MPWAGDSVTWDVQCQICNLPFQVQIPRLMVGSMMLFRCEEHFEWVTWNVGLVGMFNEKWIREMEKRKQ